MTRKVAAVGGVMIALIGLSAAIAARGRLQYVVDGDTVRLKADKYVKLIGLDAPELDKCGGRASKRRMNRLVQGRAWLKKPADYRDKDGFGWLLRYVHDLGRDAGRALIWRGYAQNHGTLATRGSHATSLRRERRRKEPTAGYGRPAGERAKTQALA